MPYTIEPPSKYTVAPPSDVEVPSVADSAQPQPATESTAAAFRRGLSEGWSAPLPGEQTLRGTFTGEMLQPVYAATHGLAAVGRGAQEALASTGQLGRDIAAMPEAFMGSPGALRVPEGAGAAAMEKAFPGAGAAVPRTPTTKAQEVVSAAFGKAVKGGQTTAMDALNTIAEARAAGQPLTISEVGGRPVRRLAGTVFRSGGETASRMEKFYKERGTGLTFDHLNTAAGERIEKAIADHIATGSYRQATKNLIAERSERARPLWEEATAGGSLAPLEKQFETAFNESSRAEQDAAKKLTSLKNEQTQAAARQSVAGNVYATSGANRAAGQADQKIRAAEFELAQARKVADETRSRLRQAQDDGSANAPGAVWSPRLQQFLDLPDWDKGIRRGLRMERRDAVTENRPFNPSEYAIVGGTDEEPEIGKVPTMKLLQVAKEGISAEIDKLRDPLTGGLSKAGRSLWRNLKAFEEEGYSLNPKWKEANDAWSGDSDSIRALQLGKKVFSMPMEDLSEDFGRMSGSDKELFKLAAASKAVEDVRKTPLAGDPSKRLINSPDELMRLRMLFESQNDFEKFVRYINRERLMFEAPVEIMGGSQTAERASADFGTGLDIAHGIGHLAGGNLMSAAAPLLRASRGLGLFQNPKLNAEVAKLLTDPNVTVTADPSGKLLFGADRASKAMGLQ